MTRAPHPRSGQLERQNLCTSIWYNRKWGRKKCYFSKLTSSKIKLLFVVNFFLLGIALSFIILPSFHVQISTSTIFFLQPHKTETSCFPLQKFPDSPMRALFRLQQQSPTIHVSRVPCPFLYQVILIFSQATPSTLGVDPHLIQYSRLYKINVVPNAKIDVQ